MRMWVETYYPSKTLWIIHEDCGNEININAGFLNEQESYELAATLRYAADQLEKGWT